MALTILRDIVNSMEDSGYYSIMAEESSDVSNAQQFVICIRWVHNVLEPHEDFIGIHAVEIANAKKLYLILKDIILRLGLNRELLRGQCYDGCSTMMGKVSGVAQIIKQDINHRGLVVHSFCHSLSLSCSDTIKNCTLMKNSLNPSFEITKLVKFSPKRESHLKEIIAEDMSTEFVNKTIRSFSQTRWTVRGKSLQSIFTFYKKLKNLWDWCLSEYGEPDIKAKVIGIKTQMKNFDFFFGIR